MDVKYEISQMTNLTESVMLDCYYIVSQCWPNEAGGVFYALKNKVKKPEHVMFAAMENMNMRGFISGHLVDNHGDKGEAKIDWLFVDAAYHGSGIGGALLRAYIEYCRERGVGELMVQPAQTDKAKRFYAKHGFAPRGIVTWARNVVMLGR